MNPNVSCQGTGGLARAQPLVHGRVEESARPRARARRAGTSDRHTPDSGPTTRERS